MNNLKTKVSEALKNAALNESAKHYLLQNSVLFNLLLKGAKRYIGGENLEDTILTVKKSNANNFPTSIEFMGESVSSVNEANEVTQEFLKIIDAIKKELANPENIYHIIKQDDKVAGFSKMELNMKNPAIDLSNVSKMDQIYLLDSFQGLKLGAKLLSYNINYSKSCGQNGMWLVVWVGNTTAITFYEKFGFHVVTRDEFHLTGTHLSPCYIMFLKYEIN